MTLRRKVVWIAVLVLLAVTSFAPEHPTIPVAGATVGDGNRKSFWYGPWGRSGVHKDIDIFAKKGTNVVAPTYGVVIFRGTIELGGRVLVLLGPKLRLHYFAHLDSWEVGPGRFVATGWLRQ
jgi:peptidoglycan LD-endopeptidase LytH